MEIFEVLVALVDVLQVCGCFLEVFGLTSTVGTGVAAVKVRKNRQARKTARQTGQAPPPSTPWLWVFWVLLLLSLFMICLVLVKWFHGRPAA
jgi:hypothetical protein